MLKLINQIAAIEISLNVIYTVATSNFIRNANSWVLIIVSLSMHLLLWQDNFPYLDDCKSFKLIAMSCTLIISFGIILLIITFEAGGGIPNGSLGG